MAYVSGEHTYDDVEDFLNAIAEHEQSHDSQEIWAWLWDHGETDEAPVYQLESGGELMALTPGILIFREDGYYQYHTMSLEELPQFIEDSE